MRNLTLFLVFFCGLTAQVQTLNDSVCIEFVYQKINELNVKIWNAVQEKEVIGYVNDSFNQVLSDDIIDGQVPMEYGFSVPNPDYPNDPYDQIHLTLRVTFDSTSDFSGMMMSYSHTKTVDVQMKLLAIAPVFALGPDRPNYIRAPYFWVKIEDLKGVLGSDFEFYNALLSMRTLLLDFQKVSPLPRWKLDKETYLVNQTVNEDLVFQDFHYNQDTLIGRYLSHLFFERLYEQEDDLSLYKDYDLKEEYLNWKDDLRVSSKYTVPNPENPNDPSDLIYRESVTWFDFRNLRSVNILKLGNDFVLEISIPDLNGWGDKNGAEQKKLNLMYCSYGDVVSGWGVEDQIILEALLKELTK